MQPVDGLPDLPVTGWSAGSRGMGDLSNDRFTSKIRLEESRDDIEGVGIKTEKKKRRYMRSAFGDIKVPGHTSSQLHPVPCKMLSVSRDLHRAGRIASGPTGDIGMLSQSWRLGGIA